MRHTWHEHGLPTDPLEAYRAALSYTQDQFLRNMLDAQGVGASNLRGEKLVEEVVHRLSEPRFLESRLAGMESGARVALGLYALTEAVSWPLSGLAHALECLGVASAPTIAALLERGLLAEWTNSQATIAHYRGSVEYDITMAKSVDLVIHPAVRNICRSALPAGEPLPVTSAVRHVREADGLEPILRLAAIWQRVVEAPLRLTNQGTFYKRDRDRLEDDTVLAGPIADCLEPLPDMMPLWLTLARGLGLVLDDTENDRVVAAPGAFWTENAVHLPQMIATRWLALRTWHEQGGIVEANARFELAVPFARPAFLLWLATLAEGEWLAIDDLASRLEEIYPAWSKHVFAPLPEGHPDLGGRPKASGKSARARPYTALLEAILLGPAYQFGLVRAAEEDPSGQRVVQLSPLGRYALALGPPPAPRQVFDQFLYVQPNFEVVAYRQGLDPIRIGQLCRFARWSQVGAAVELKLTAEWIYHGLEGGLTSDAILERLARHSARPVPAGITEAVRTWGGRRDRIAYHASGTLVEFASAEGLERALAEWPASTRPGPVRIAERLLLVEDESTIPFHRFRQTGSRDYRRPAETCLEIEQDGVTLALDLGRSDLLVDAELARLADELPAENPHNPSGSTRRRFRVSLASLARATEAGMTPALLSDWFQKRAGAVLPPAVKLLLHAAQPKSAPFRTSRPLVLLCPSADLLDGLAQHPATRDYLDERLGPTAITVLDEALPMLERALAALGLSLDDHASGGGRSLRINV